MWVRDTPCDDNRGGEDERMKLNFWQWIGIALLLLGVVWYIMREKGKAATKTAMSVPAHSVSLTCPTSQIL